jgi:hypothetical protein
MRNLLLSGFTSHSRIIADSFRPLPERRDR